MGGMKYPSHLIKLIEVLKRLPGVGSKSAERFAFDMLQWQDAQLREMGDIIAQTPERLHHCATCGCLMGDLPCTFCDRARMSSGSLCIIASARDVFAIEATREYHGSYHVLGGLLSPMEGRGPESLHLSALISRIAQGAVREVILALDSTLEGDATALYLKNALEKYSLSVSRLAFGLPMGSSLEYVDGGTLARALSGRSAY